MKELLSKVTSGNFIVSAIIAVVAVIIFFTLDKVNRKNQKSYRNLNDPKIIVIRRLIIAGKIFISLFAVILICQINGINLTSAVAGLGILSAIVGLAMQDILKDIIMGVHIISDKFFSVGDCVEYGGREGIIVGFTMKTTKIGDLEDHSVITVCNRNITEIRKLDERLDIDVALSYTEDIGKISVIMKDIAKAIEGFENVTKCSYKGLQSFGESAIIHKIRIHCNPTRRAEIRRQAHREILLGFRKSGIEIPFNQIDVHLINNNKGE